MKKENLAAPIMYDVLKREISNITHFYKLAVS